jgi:uncharacterized membrane protein YhhN
MTVASILVVLASTAALMWADVVDSPAKRWIKMVASTGFIAVALSVGALSSNYGRTVLIALALSWMGDLLLTFESRRAFLGGLAVFLLGHVAYSVAFGRLGVDPVATALAGALVVTVAIVVWRWLSPHVGDMKAPVIAYIAVISVMVVLAFGAFSDDNTWLIPMGATLFFVSDLFVARNQFVTAVPLNRLWGLPLYYTAQVLLALSIAS